jgi:hypothetical protein
MYSMVKEYVNAKDHRRCLEKLAAALPKRKAALIRSVLPGIEAPIDDITLTGVARRIAGATDETGTAVLKARATGESRIDLTFPSGARTEVYANSANGLKGSSSGPDGLHKQVPLFNIVVDSAWFSPALMSSKLARSADTVASAVTPESRSGKAVEHLTVSKQFPQAPAQIASLMQRHSQVEIYLDASSFLPDTLGFNTHADRDAGRDVPVEIHYSDYREVGGIQLPFRVQKYINGGLVLELEFQRAEMNADLASDQFNVPEPPAPEPASSTAH